MDKLDMYSRNFGNFGVANLPPKNKPTQGRLATPEEINAKQTKSKKQKRKEAKMRKKSYTKRTMIIMDEVQMVSSDTYENVSVPTEGVINASFTHKNGKWEATNELV